MSIRNLAPLLALFFVITEPIHAQVATEHTASSFETSNCRTQSKSDPHRQSFSEDNWNRADCLTIQALSILALNSFIPGQTTIHEDHVNQADQGVVEFVDPKTGLVERCEYSVVEGQTIAPFLLRFMNNQLNAETDGVTSMRAALKKARRDALKSVFIGCDAIS